MKKRCNGKRVNYLIEINFQTLYYIPAFLYLYYVYMFLGMENLPHMPNRPMILIGGWVQVWHDNLSTRIPAYVCIFKENQYRGTTPYPVSAASVRKRVLYGSINRIARRKTERWQLYRIKIPVFKYSGPHCTHISDRTVRQIFIYFYNSLHCFFYYSQINGQIVLRVYLSYDNNWVREIRFIKMTWTKTEHIILYVYHIA